MRAPHSAWRVVNRCIVLAALGLATAATPALAAEAPTISVSKTVAITDTAARLEATISPNGAKTQYRFEYLTDAAYQANPAGERFVGATQALGTTEIPAEEKGKPVIAETVAVAISGLSPNTAYRFRPLASNAKSKGKVIGPEGQFLTFRVLHVFGPCPNDALRADRPAASLSDCRAYEQATPVQKTGDIVGSIKTAKASINGDAVSFQSIASLPYGEGAQTSAPLYLSSRNGEGWSTQGLLPPESAGQQANVRGWTPDFAQVFDTARKFTKPTTYTFLSRSSGSGPLRTIVAHTAAMEESRPVGVSADGSKVFFEAGNSALTPNSAPGKNNLYVWDRETETLRLAGALNNGSEGAAPAMGAFAGPYDWVEGIDANSLEHGGVTDENYVQDMHAVASDGSGVYFTAAKTGQLYLRKNPAMPQSPLDGEGKCTNPGLACTVHVSASQRSTPDTAGAAPAAFMGATPDGAHAYFTSSEKLTADATTGPEQPAPTIGRAELSSGAGKDLSFLPKAAAGITVFGEYIYWANPSAGTIGRAKLNGVNPPNPVEPDFIDEEGGSPQYVAVDSEHIYWTNTGELGQFGPLAGNGTIGRAGIEGENPQLDFIKGAGDPQGIAVREGQIYWANSLGGYCANGTCYDLELGIGKAPVSGANPKQEFIPLDYNQGPYAVAVDANHIYWTSESHNGFNTDELHRVDLDGHSNRKDRFISDGHQLRGIAVDSGHVYAAEQSGEAIVRADLELSSASLEKEFIGVEGSPKGVAVDGEHIYWSANGEPHPNLGSDLYRFDASSGDLTDVAPDQVGPNGAEVLGLLGGATDGSYLYFVANGVLATGATQGDCPATLEHGSGECNLYLDHEGQVSFIARLRGSGDSSNWRARSIVNEGNPAPRTSRVSPDGRTLLFSSSAQLTSYDNEGVPELYRYRAGDLKPLCISCSPIGAPPVGAAVLEDVSTPSDLQVFQPAPILSRNLSPSGDRVFFQTPDALVAQDVNGNGAEASPCPLVKSYKRCQDAYEWEAAGTGSCDSALENGGCLYLLSSGTDPSASFFIDASPSGDDAFILTGSRFVGQDQDDLKDIYDARVNGGLATQDPQPQPICEGEACKAGATAPPASQSPGSASFAGPGNPKPHHRKPKPRKKKRHHHAQKRHNHNRKGAQR